MFRVHRLELKARADCIAAVAQQKGAHADHAEIALAKALARQTVYLRVGARAADALNVAHEQLVAGALVRKVTEGLRGRAKVLAVAVRVDHGAHIVIVLGFRGAMLANIENESVFMRYA